MKYVGIDKALIGIEDNKPEAIKLMQEKTAQMSNVEVVSLPSRYPQGAEKVLIEQCTGRQVPPGKLPSDVGCIVMNVASAGFLGGYLKNGIPLTTKRVTLMVLQLQKLRTSEFRSVLRLKILLHSAADTKVHRPN